MAPSRYYTFPAELGLISLFWVGWGGWGVVVGETQEIAFADRPFFFHCFTSVDLR